MVVLRRVGLALLAGLNLWWGVWALAAPRGFYDAFPGFGHRWTAAYPPYNEHLIADLGATFLTLAVLLALAVFLDDPRVRRVVLAGVLVFNGLHLAFHATHRGVLSLLDYGASLATLVGGAALPAVLLGLEFWPRRRPVP